MKDKYGREIDYLRISITDRCNLRCIYCMPEDGICQVSHKEILTYDEIQRICSCITTLGIKKIKLTGRRTAHKKKLFDPGKNVKRTSGDRKSNLNNEWNVIERTDTRIGRGWD